MKNNEIMISARFEFGDGSGNKELSFLVLKDITLKAFLESLYYGLKKSKGLEECSELFERYIKTRKEIQVLYTAKGIHNVIDLNAVVGKGEDKCRIYDMGLDQLGFVTSSCLLITMDKTIRPSSLFKDEESSYILSENDSLEYNISTRRLNVIEASVIDIIPPNELPQKDKASIFDVIIPTVLSTGGMVGARFLIMKFARGSAAMGNTMLLMSAAMGIVSLVTSLYNYMKKRGNYKKSIAEWKENYENYIARIIRTIKEWQESDIVYLNSVYPSMDKLFSNTAEINGIIFARSQNDNDFMKISLGTSDEVKPLFEIKSEKKDSVYYDVYYKMKKEGDGIEIILPSSKKKDRKLKKMSPEEIMERNRNKFLLTDLSYNFANKGVDSKNGDEVIGFNYLRSDTGKKPPLLIDLKDCGALGVISDNDETSHHFIQHVVFELAYYHSPEDLQFVFFFDKESDPEKQNAVVRNYKYLPHTNELFDGISQFVFDKESSGIVFGQLLSLMNERSQNKAESESEDSAPDNSKLTQVVCVVFCDYDIKETGFSKFLPEVPKEGEPYVNALGLTFIFIQSVKDKLPKYCGNIINIDHANEGERKVSLRYNVLSRETLNVLSEDKSDRNKVNDTDNLIEYKYFRNKFIFGPDSYDDKFALAYKQLSAIYYTRIAENGKVPSMVTLFELYGFNSEKVENGDVKESIRESWQNVDKNDVTRNLRVPIGKNEHGAMCLDLYEKADGPHMLVAGTTGSGKSETIITYLIGLCMKYSPMDLNLMLVDMKGGGFSDRLGGLPHCVGVVTDTAGEDEGTSAAYMLKRFLETLNAEIKKRKLLLSIFGVDTADAYIRALRLMRKIKALEKDPAHSEEADSLKKKLNDKQKEMLKKDISELPSLSHLVLVVDEFTELKRFSSESDDVDFIAEITTIARVGRTLGFHIILVSQNIEGAITDDIRVNSKARVCLKVATKQASKEMLGSPAAAAPTMPLNGRAYLLVGTGSRFEYFQSAYTGANKNLNIEPAVNVTLVPNSGSFNKEFYSSKKDNIIEKKKSANVSEHDTQLAFIVNTIIDIGRNMEKPRQIFLPPLPTVIMERSEWEGAE